jgi:site-specific DNA-cytosine methylase
MFVSIELSPDALHHREGTAQTLKTEFPTLGRGRYIHLKRPNKIPPHEGARIQDYPDGYKFRLAGGSRPTK